MKKYIYFITIVLIVTMSGCAISRKVPYHNLEINLPKVNTKNISIAIWDQREQLINGHRKPDFVGYLRSGAGIAYPIGTVSGNAFADDIAWDIKTSYNRIGIKCTVSPTYYKDDKNTVLRNLLKTKSNKLILIKCNQLHTDGYSSEALLYNLQVLIYDKNGNLLAEKIFSGKKQLGKGMKYKEYMPNGLKELLETIFNNITIYNALNYATTKAYTSKPVLISSPKSNVVNKHKQPTGKEKIIPKDADIIYLNDGSSIVSKVIEITENTIKYKIYDNINGPIRNISIKNVFMIIYKNGQREIFKK